MFEIIKREQLNSSVVLIEVVAPRIARKAKAGQFVILRADERGERIPLTIAGAEGDRITLIFQTVGDATMTLAEKRAGDSICDLAGPLGKPTDTNFRRAVVVGGGVGCAIALPVARALKEGGAEVASVVGFRSRELVILEKEFRAVSDTFVMMTDDGSYGEKGNVCLPLPRIIEEMKPEAVFAVGPLVMMKFVAAATKKYGVKTIASMNPIMVDGTGMCGCCRLTVGGKMKFACVDGPDFDAHQVDFDEAIRRSSLYAPFEKRAREEHCNLFRAKEESDA